MHMVTIAIANHGRALDAPAALGCERLLSLRQAG
jgi:hypothetical protein